jgi:hypothetical protein
MTYKPTAERADTALENGLDWRTKAYLVGGVVGTLVGVGAAYLYVNSAEQQTEAPKMQAGEAVGIGLAILALLRQIAGLPDEGKNKKTGRRK